MIVSMVNLSVNGQSKKPCISLMVFLNSCKTQPAAPGHFEISQGRSIFPLATSFCHELKGMYRSEKPGNWGIVREFHQVRDLRDNREFTHKNGILKNLNF